MTRREYQEEYNESANYPYDDTDVAFEKEESEEHEEEISDEQYGYKRALLDLLNYTKTVTADESENRAFVLSAIDYLKRNYTDKL